MELLLGSYINNSLFRFQEAEWAINAEYINQFNNLYESIFETSDDKLNKISLSKDCIYYLDRIFKTLLEGERDDFEKSFIKELHVYTSSLLEREIKNELNKDRSCKYIDHDFQDKFKNLTKDYFFIDQLPNDVVNRLFNSLSKSMSELRSIHEAGGISRDVLTISSYEKMRIPIKILNKYFENTSILIAVSKYMGCQYEVGGLALELSVDNAGWWGNSLESIPTSNVRYVHIDESIHAPKAIIYMSDVIETNGPTSCYPGIYEKMEITPIQSLVGRVIGYMGSSDDSLLKSCYERADTSKHVSKSENFRRHFMKLPASLRFNSHIGWDIEVNSNCEKLLINSEMKILGRAGKYIVFDGAKLFHRGGMVCKGERFALQLIFERKTFSKSAIRFIKEIWLTVNEKN